MIFGTLVIFICKLARKPHMDTFLWFFQVYALTVKNNTGGVIEWKYKKYLP